MSKLIKRINSKIFDFYFKNQFRFRKRFFLERSKANLIGSPIIKQPSLFIGDGTINFGDLVQLGYYPSPYFFSGYSHLEARNKESQINFGNDIIINNNLVIIAEKNVSICNNVLIGTNVEIYDSDFHSVLKNRRGNKNHSISPVLIKENVWIGSNVKILKGVEIGENTVISNSSVVTKSFPSNVIIGGIPAKIISNIDND
jgi:acetyltransferase-like isoleucine patch superfamily enzyme